MHQNIVEGKGWQTLETTGTMLLQGWTSLHNAIDSGSAQTARALLAHGADANLEFPECKDDSCEKQASFPTAFGHQSYSLAATASVAYHPSLCSSRCCNNNTSASLCAQFPHDIVAVSHSAYHSCKTCWHKRYIALCSSTGLIALRKCQGGSHDVCKSPVSFWSFDNVPVQGTDTAKF